MRVQFRVLIIFPAVTTFRLWFFWLTFLVLFLVRATTRVVLVLCPNVLAIGLARLVFVHELQTCRVPRFSFSPAWYCVVILATVGCETVVFRLLPSPVEFAPFLITGRNDVVT